MRRKEEEEEEEKEEENIDDEEKTTTNRERSISIETVHTLFSLFRVTPLRKGFTHTTYDYDHDYT